MVDEIVKAYVCFVGKECSLSSQRERTYELLRFASNEVFSLNDFNIYKDKNGKPYTDEFCFSVSHTQCAVAVALSSSSVGIDVELSSSKVLRVAKKIFARGVEVDYEKLDETTAAKFWTRKEAVFKAHGGAMFRPESICECGLSVVTDKIDFGEEVLCVSVAGEFACVELTVMNEDRNVIDVRRLTQ